MSSKKVTFQNEAGERLVARLERPVDQHPHTYALFAHCFTCGKSLQAVRQISRTLSLHGFAVLRLDFTGLGESEGDFAETNFSSNIEDLVRAGRFLEDHFAAPGLLVGHSLGGAASLCAAHELPSVRAVATIGSPFDPEHVSHLLEGDLEDIRREGLARVVIGGRTFTVKQQFLEDIRETSLEQHLASLDRALLIMHAPQDGVVAIENAARMYHAARHPKSFLSLDGADHLLSDPHDAAYAGEMIAAWARRYLEIPKDEKLKRKKEVAVRLGRQGFTTDIMMRHHGLTADEPPEVGGQDFGPSPYELLSASLGACTAMTLQMYARRKGWDLREVIVHLAHFKDYAKDAREAEDAGSKIDHFDRLLELEGDLDEKQRARLMEIADKCPVHRTLHGDIVVNTTLAKG